LQPSPACKKDRGLDDLIDHAAARGGKDDSRPLIPETSLMSVGLHCLIARTVAAENLGSLPVTAQKRSPRRVAIRLEWRLQKDARNIP
jgi:hypothetical protein